MYDKVGNNIILVRGDSASIPFYINEGTALLPVYHDLTANEVFAFYLFKNNDTWEDAIVTKICDQFDQDSSGAINVVLKPEDTIDLSGTYWYCTKLLKEISSEENEVNTIVPNSRFQIID